MSGGRVAITRAMGPLVNGAWCKERLKIVTLCIGPSVTSLLRNTAESQRKYSAPSLKDLVNTHLEHQLADISKINGVVSEGIRSRGQVVPHWQYGGVLSQNVDMS